MKKNAVGLVRLAVLGTALASPMAWADWEISDRGSPHAAGDSGTVKVVDQQAKNTWQDWYWRGEKEGFKYQCPWAGGDTCTATWNATRTKSTTIGLGGGVEAGGNSSNWLKKAIGSLAGNFKFSYDRTQTTSASFAQGVTIKRGQFAEPIFVQVRVWQRGHFMNGWVEDKTKWENRWTYYHYVWTGNITYGAWTTNTAVAKPYMTFNIYS